MHQIPQHIWQVSDKSSIIIFIESTQLEHKIKYWTIKCFFVLFTYFIWFYVIARVSLYITLQIKLLWFLLLMHFTEKKGAEISLVSVRTFGGKIIMKYTHVIDSFTTTNSTKICCGKGYNLYDLIDILLTVNFFKRNATTVISQWSQFWYRCIV